MIYTPHQILFDWLHQGVCERPVNWHKWGWRKCKQGYDRTHHL